MTMLLIVNMRCEPVHFEVVSKDNKAILLQVHYEWPMLAAAFPSCSN